jgi:signal transduction histidine kinase/DNA-binding response OmpR family regulator
VLVAAASARLALDDDYRGFLELVTGQIGTAVASARQFQEAKERAAALAELDRAKTVFFSNVSHEFRTPLTLLLAPLEEAAADPGLAPEQRERLELARRNAFRLLKLVNTLLDFSRIEAGRAEASYEPTDLAELTRDVASVFRSAVERAGLRFVVDCPRLQEPVYVDRDLWEKIVLNLVSNAFKFTFEGEIEVRLRARRRAVELTVRDTGTGIPEEEVPRLFERFHRIRGARARTHEGTGTGLALVQELVRLHGGSIEVATEVGKGTAFTVRLPLGHRHLPADRLGVERALASTATGAAPYVAEALAALRDPEAVLDPGAPEAPAVVDRSRRILLADDNADMREYVARLLGERWTVETVGDGVAALDAARARPPDLVVADVMMPGLGGFELLRELRAEPATSAVPVLLLSARAGEEAAVEGLEAGADEYLVKPFSARELVARVASQLELARIRAQARRLEHEHAARLAGLNEVMLALNSAPTLTEVLDVVTAQARKLVGAHAAVTSFTGGEDGGQSITRISLSDEYAARRDTFERHPPPPGLLAAPLVAEDGTSLGLIHLSDKVEGEFTATDEAVLVQLAQIASSAVQRARLYRAAEERAEAARVLEAVGDGVLLVGRDGCVRHWNRAAEAITGIRSGDAVGRAMTEVVRGWSGLAPQIAVATEPGTEQIRPVTLPFELPGGERWLSISGVASASGTVYAFRDVSAERELERLRSDFVATVSHELRTPLAAILGAAKTLERPDLADRQDVHEQLVEMISAESARLARIVEDILLANRLDSGPFELHSVAFDLRHAAAQAAESLSRSTQRVAIAVHVPTVPALVVGDPDRFHQVLVNLVDNAVKYSNSGRSVEVRIESGDRSWIASVQDHGRGIPLREQERIFERFYRLDPNMREGVSGSGLGLYIARELVQRMSGRIWVESSEGEGSTFRVELPAAD